VSFNKIFKPENFSKTYGEMTMEEHALYSSRGDALRKLKGYIDF
jgi:inosine/xanthosine triphosphate pyrophosphatase family protein